MARKPTRWGRPGHTRIHEENGWFIGVRDFEFTDAEGGTIWQYKVARNRDHFHDPQSSHLCWVSKASPYKRKHFQTREEALAATRAHITQVTKTI